MAYQDSPMTVNREMSPTEQLHQAAGRLSAVSGELSEHAGNVNEKRNQLHQAEGELARSQVEFDDAVRAFRALLDQYGLTMDMPMPEKRF
jgi:chemotaxis protein histidine kinase CheA